VIRRAAALATVLVSVALQVFADDRPMRLDQPDEGHGRARHFPPLDMMWIPPHPTTISPRVVYNLPDGLGAFAKVDRVLSQACRRLAFIQKVDRHFWARTRERSYGVAFPTGGSLVDYRKLAKPDKVYFFEDQGGDCAVWIGDMKKLIPHYVSP